MSELPILSLKYPFFIDAKFEQPFGKRPGKIGYLTQFLGCPVYSDDSGDYFSLEYKCEYRIVFRRFAGEREADESETGITLSEKLGKMEAKNVCVAIPPFELNTDAGYFCFLSKGSGNYSSDRLITPYEVPGSFVDKQYNLNRPFSVFLLNAKDELVFRARVTQSDLIAFETADDSSGQFAYVGFGDDMKLMPIDDIKAAGLEPGRSPAECFWLSGSIAKDGSLSVSVSRIVRQQKTKDGYSETGVLLPRTWRIGCPIPYNYLLKLTELMSLY